MRKLLALVLVICISCSLSGCALFMARTSNKVKEFSSEIENFAEEIEDEYEDELEDELEDGFQEFDKDNIDDFISSLE